MNDSSKSPAARTGQIDMNADLGEGFANDRQLLGLVTSASICCGAHAGSPDVIRQTLRDALACGVVVGAHPGYPDRAGFGRRDQTLTDNEIVDLIISQLDDLETLAAEIGVQVRYIKPHGALYNQAQRQFDVAIAVARAAELVGLPLLGQPGSVLEAEALKRRVTFFPEGFPDRRYRADGSLIPRSQPDAILSTRDEIEAQVLQLVSDGRVATLCIHGDDPRAVANAELVRAVLTARGILIGSFRDERD
jgi:UPF0271 protein